MIKVTEMTTSELKNKVDNTGSKFFNRDTMRTFGDTMSNYGVTGPLEIMTVCGETASVYELYRKKPVKANLQASAYFRVENFARTYIQK